MVKWKGARIMKKTITALIMTMFLAGPVFAGPLMLKQVSSSANWVVHADYEQFKNTKFGQLFRAELAAIGVEEKLTNFAAIFSFHPIDDVRDITLYGIGPDKNKAVVLIDGNFNEEKLVAIVRMNIQHAEIPHGDITIHQWLNEDKNDPGKNQLMYGCLHSGTILIMSSGLDAVKSAIDVLKDSAGNAATALFTQSALNAKDAFFQVAANNLSQIADQQQNAAILKETEQLSLAVGESEGRFYADLGLTAMSQEVAQNINKVLQGIIAYLTLAGQQQSNLARLVAKTQVSCTNNTVKIHFDSDPDSVFNTLKEQWQKKQQQTQKQ